MDSLGELILKGHFSRLKDQINAQTGSVDRPLQGEALQLLEEISSWFKKRAEKKVLDQEGVELYHQLTELLAKLDRKDQTNFPGKLPMKKVNRKRMPSENKGRETGT